MPLPRFPLLFLGLATLSAADLPVTRLQVGDITRTIQLLGEVRPRQQTTLHAKVAGFVKTLRADLGDRVEAGSILAELEVPELVADEARTRAELTLAELEQKRIQEAFRQAPDLVTRQSVDAAEAKLAVARAQQQRNATLLEFARIRAPFAGVVSRRHVDLGAFVPAGNGSQASQLFTLTDDDAVRIQAAVPEAEAGLVAVGQGLTITTESTGSLAFTAKVTRLAGVLEHPSQTMLVETELPNPGRRLKPGMFANARLGVETHARTNLLPLKAVVMEKAVATAYVHDGGVARRRVLKAGFNDGINLEVLEGILPNEEVIVGAGAPLVDGQNVKTTK
jgi:membrane fusion protein (multidrug efflux system)